MVGVWYRRNLRGTGEASNGGRMRVCIIHGLNISHKELTYLLQKSTSHQNQALHTCSQGEGWQELTITRSRPPHIRRTNQRDTSCFKFVTQQLPYVHATGITNLNTSISFSNSQLLHQNDSNITIFIYQNNHNEFKLLIVFNALYMKVFIISLLDAYHILGLNL